MKKHYQPIWSPRSHLTQRVGQVLRFENRLNIVLTQINPNTKVLDIGCNAGWNSFEINYYKKCHVTGIDKNTGAIKTANNIVNNYNLNNITFYNQSILEFFNNCNIYYDYCIFYMFFHHLLENKHDVWEYGTPFVVSRKGRLILEHIKSKCKSVFVQARLHYKQKKGASSRFVDDVTKKLPSSYTDNQLIEYFINELKFKFYKILRTDDDNYFRAPNITYMFSE